MRIFCALCGLFLAIAIVNCSPIVKRETEEDLSPLNEVYVFEAEPVEADDGERGDRDKRKIGLTLGVKNGIINFVFTKLDNFIDSKTRALAALDDSNRAKNAAFGIDASQSATSQFLSTLVSQKIQGATGSIGPLINSATTLVSGASAGLSNALASKIAPLSSLSGGLSGGTSGGSAGGSAGAAAGGAAGGSGSAIIGNLLSQKIGTLSTLSQSSGGLSNLSGLLGGLSSSSGGSSGDSSGNTSGGSSAGASAGGSAGVSAGGSAGGNAGASAGAGAGINLGAFANLAGTATTTEDTPIFDRTRVSFDIPSNAFATGFTLITNVSQILNSLIVNSARRTQTVLEIFKPFFRGAFAIKGLPSDNSN